MSFIALIYLLLHLTAAFSGNQAFWGVDSWGYYNGVYIFLFFISGSIVIIPGINDKIADFFAKTGNKLSKYPFWLLSVFVCAILLLLSQDTYFLGDGLLRISETEKGVFFTGAEPLDTFIHNITHYVVNALLFDDASDWFSGDIVYRYISIISGILVLFAIRKYYRNKENNNNSPDSMIMGMVIFSAGFAQLFFGYVESYTLLALTLLLFLFSTISMLKKNEFSYTPTVFFSLSILLHPVSGLLFPAMLYSYYLILKDKKYLYLSKVIAIPALFVLVLLVVFGLGGLTPDKIIMAYSEKSRLLPMFSNGEYYGIFSLGHLTDIINQILLVFPAIIGIPLIFSRKNTILKPVNSFLALSSLLLFVPLVILKPELGFARDWDLFSIFSIPLTVLVALRLIHLKEKRAVKALIIIGISLIHTLPWIGVNADEDMSVLRAEKLASADYWAKYSKSLLYNDLSRYYYHKRNLEKALELSEKSYENEQNPRFLWSLASLAEKTGRIDKAIRYFTILSGDKKHRPDALARLADLHLGSENYNEAKNVLLQITEYEQDNPKLYFMLGVAYIKMNDFNNALNAFKNAKYLDSTANIAIANLAENANNAKKFDEAGSYYRILLDMEPANPILNFNLAAIYFYKKEYRLSEEYISKAEKLGFDSTLVYSLRNDIKNDTLSKTK